MTLLEKQFLTFLVILMINKQKITLSEFLISSFCEDGCLAAWQPKTF
jgi:hypothetical protein